MDRHCDEPLQAGVHAIQAAAPQPWNIFNFYAAPSKNDPWIPSGVIQAPLSNDQAGPPAYTPGHFVQNPTVVDYRTKDSPSECATLPGDSGYGSSHHAFSVASRSVHGEEAGLDSCIGQAPANCPMNTALDSLSPPQFARSATNISCPDPYCKTVLRSQGQLKKHMQRHLRIHKCPYPNCAKSHHGFSTANDLVRHKRSVHAEQGLPGRSFICPHCMPEFAGPKVWPRADNFRSHLLRAHRIKLDADDDHQRFLYDESEAKDVGEEAVSEAQAQPMPPPDPILSNRTSTIGLQEQDIQLLPGQDPYQAQIGIDPALFQDPPAGAEHEDDGFMHPMAFSPMTRPLEAYSSDHRELRNDYVASKAEGEPVEESALSLNQDNWQLGKSGFGESTTVELDTLRTAEVRPQQIWSRADGSALMDMVKINGDPCVGSNPQVIVKYLKLFPKEFLQTALQGDVQESENACQPDEDPVPRSRIGCMDCPKTFSRQCELKKHMKRHMKPYGCTFKRCFKRFGSKNDWKRHESSQHYQLETWNCDVRDCSKSCQRRDNFKIHLQQEHGLVDSGLMEEKLESCRMGRHCDPRFWCGFCVSIVEIDVRKRGSNSWTTRCDHIDSHLFGKDDLPRKNIGEWRHQNDEGDDSESPCCDDGSEPTASPALGEMESNERKRRKGSPGDERRLKKASNTQDYVWTCCMCPTMMNFKTSLSCIECGHMRCSLHCTIEQVPSDDDVFGGEFQRDRQPQGGTSARGPC
ncbi:hypothetical protein RJ55_03178 [Drechmeria coniospora]|nr:hypothetical protein RJ55_03178 [Drechmeria coniospora]